MRRFLLVPHILAFHHIRPEIVFRPYAVMKPTTHLWTLWNEYGKR